MAQRGVNKVILIGNVGQDPELRYMQNGNAVANITLATSESWNDKNSGEKQERTEWHRLVFFRRLAEIVGEYVKKGSKIYIEGKLQTRKWQDNNGQDRYTTEINVDQMQLLDSRGGQQGGQQSNHDNYQHGSSQQNQQPRQESIGSSDFDDDIPF